MRVLFGLCLFGAAIAAARHNPPVVIAGIKTPGVRIPFASLKPEVELPAPAKPAWLYFADALFAPNAKDGLDKIDSKVGAKADAKAPAPATSVIPVPKACAGMVSAFGSLWIPSCADGSLVRIDAKTLKQTAKFNPGVDSVTHAVVASPDSVWLLTDAKTTLSRIDPDQNMVVGELRVPAGCKGLAFGETALWLACSSDNKVYRIDPATNLVVNQIEVSAEPESIGLGEGSVWVLCRKEGKVERIDPKTNKVVKTLDLMVPGVGGEIAVGEGSVWVTMPGFPLARISPLADKEKVVQQFYGSGGGAIAIGASSVWLSNTPAGNVWKIDPKRIVATLAE